MHGFVLYSVLVSIAKTTSGVYNIIYTGSVSAHHPRCLDTNSIEIIHHSNHGRHLYNMPVCVSL